MVDSLSSVYHQYNNYSNKKRKMSHHLNFLPNFFFLRRELQIIASPGPPGGPGSPALPLHNPPLARGAHCHDPDLHYLLPVGGCAPGQINRPCHCSLASKVNLTHSVGV